VLIKQNNLTIRDAMKADAPILGNWWRDGAVMAHAGFPNGLDVSDAQIAEGLSSETDDTSRRLIIELDGTPVGEMSYRYNGERIPEIGIKICDVTQREKGYGTMLVRMLLAALFFEKHCEKVYISTNLNNLRAQHVYEKIGFRRLRVNHNVWKDQLGQVQSFVDYELTREEFS
jgi:RimJ/RimL family protein N-acetyltransferase